MSTASVPSTSTIMSITPSPTRPVPTEPKVAIVPLRPVVATVRIRLFATVPPSAVPDTVMVSPDTNPVPAVFTTVE